MKRAIEIPPVRREDSHVRRRTRASADRAGSARHAKKKREAPRATTARPSVPAPARNVRRPDAPPGEAAPSAARGRSLRERLGRLGARLKRPLASIGRILVAVAVVAGAIALGRLVERHVRTSPAFATRAVAISGLERLEREEVLTAAGIELGQNVFELPPEEAEARLERHPWIAEADVVRRLPGSYEISIREHRAAAVLALERTGTTAARLYLVADDGTVFKRLGDADPADLPVITGVDGARFVRDPAWRTTVLLAAVALLSDFRGAGLYRREPIAEIHVEPDDGLSLYLGSDALRVRLGRGPYRQKLARLRRVLDRLASEDARPAYVYLDNVRRPDRVTVRLRD